jgi:MYXO-CTERM domain-containing protein
MMRPRNTFLALTACLVGSLFAMQAGAQTHTFTLDADFDTGVLNNVRHVPSDQLVLGRTPVSKTRLVWVSNTAPGGSGATPLSPGWIVRLDTTIGPNMGRQTARFDSVLLNINGQPTGVSPSGNNPGRVAVDSNGDVWIINRAYYEGAHLGSLSKFSGNIAHCIDRNNNGVIDTSYDANGDGIIDPYKQTALGTPANQVEYFAQNDECILATIPLGAVGDIPRAVAVDRNGKIWAATWQGHKLFRFNPNEPVALETSLQTSYWFYSAATADQYIYLTSNPGWAGTPNTGQIVRVNIDNINDTTAVTCGGGAGTCGSVYGIVAVPGTQTGWAGGYSGTGIYKFNFGANPPTCTCVAVPSQVTAVTLDLNGKIWASGYSTGNVFRINPTTNAIEATCATGGTSPHGLSVDFDGYIWSVQDGPNHLVRFDPVATANNCGRTNYPIDRGALPIPAGQVAYAYGPYLYSDFTGVQIDRQAPYTRLGQWEATYDGQVNGIPWSTVSWNNELQIVPALTSLAASVRAADSPSELAMAPYSPAANGSPMADIKGRYVQVKVDFKGPGYLTPVLSDLSVQGPCATLGELCCVMDVDCNDLQKCTLDQCPVPGGSCVHAPIQDCCEIDPDCNDSNACTVDSCDSAGHCQHIQQLGCCMSNTDCDDGDMCTADLCSGLGGTCSSVAINGCCMTDLDCTKGNLCSASTCPVPGGLCNIQYKPGCCQGDPDCADTDLCTQDVCDLSTNTCSNTAISDCCNLDKDCAPSGDCDIATCSGPGGVCLHEAKKDCCTPTSPEVGQDCDLPVSPFDHLPCKPGKFVCNNDKLECVGAVHPVTPEKCNWKDENCDGNIDENSCAEGEACINGICAKKCGSPEFPCPDNPGWQCKNGVCLPGTCTVEVVCPADYTCVSGDCIKGDGGTAGGAGAAGAAGNAGAAGASGAAGAAGSAPGDAGNDVSGKAGSAGSGQAGSGGNSGTGGSAAKPGDKPENFGMTTGGGGCACSAESSPGAGWQLWAAAVAAGAAIARRRRKGS